ncbi:geminin-like [Daktulosphaira vitifoliae]|uniref:geminin-like n=1 Tax=Daktulosphaira vitifoliae TaxID=58002 RepID=UPI0021AA1966|nr:geminin-like [Daktulosphaira vitifoliae]
MNRIKRLTMKTVSENASIGLPNKTSDVKKAPRKCLQTLQLGADSAKNKENLVGSGRSQEKITKDVKKAKFLKKSENENSNEKKIKEKNSSVAKVNPNLYKKLIIDDLISTVGPSEKYWEVIAERRRKALEDTLEENRKLKSWVLALEEENKSCKELLEKTTDIVKTLQECLNEENYDEKYDNLTIGDVK